MNDMSEQPPKILTPEERDENDLLELWKKDHPEVVPENLRESGPEAAEFEQMIDSFAAEHPLAKLNAIIDLTPAEAPQHPVREPARVALNSIYAKLVVIEKETNVSPEKLAELKARFRVISQAVGIINNNKVWHDR